LWAGLLLADLYMSGLDLTATLLIVPRKRRLGKRSVKFAVVKCLKS